MSQELYERFSLHPRIQHLFLFVSFTVLAFTGLPQKFHNATWALWMVNVMGGIEFVRLVHRGAAIVLILSSVYHLIYAGYLLSKKGLRVWLPMLPSLKDFADVYQMVFYFLGLRKQKPLFDQFTYREKFDYWAVFWGMVIMGGSGLILWFPTFATQWLPGIIVPLAKTAHSDEAMLAVLAVVLWHLYNAHFNPAIFPFNPTIFTGNISKRRMMDEHFIEYARLSGARLQELGTDVEVQRPWNIIALSGLTGTLVILMIGTLFYVGFQSRVPEVPPAPTRVPVVISIPPTATPGAPGLAPAGTPTPAATIPVSPTRPGTTPAVAKEAPRLPANHTGRGVCQVCHAAGVSGAPMNPPDHVGRLDATCTDCHKPQ